MANQKINVKCPKCKKIRTVSRIMVYFIKIGKGTVCCKSCSLRGNKYRLGAIQSSETRKKMSKASLGKKKSLQHRLNMSRARMGIPTGFIPRSAFKKGRVMTREQIRKCLTRRKMSGLEMRVDNVIRKYNLPYKFVGNGKFFIERTNPDFVNTNGEKKAVEVYWKNHKDLFHNGGCKGWMKKRSDVFSKYGWEIIFMEGTELTQRKILDYLGKGVV